MLHFWLCIAAAGGVNLLAERHRSPFNCGKDTVCNATHTESEQILVKPVLSQHK